MKTTTPVPRKTNVLIVNGAKISPSATAVPRSVTKQAARMVLPYSVVLNHGIDDGNRRGGHCNAGKPTRHQLPAKQVMGRGREPQKGKDEARKSDRRGLLPFEPEHLRIKLGSREKGQHDRAQAGQELHPGFISTQH